MGEPIDAEPLRDIYKSAPAAWIDLLSTHWVSVHVAEILVRTGTKAGWRNAENARVILDDKEETDVRAAAEDVATELYARGWDLQSEHGAELHLQLVLYSIDEKGNYTRLAQTTRGGRLRQGESEDAPDDDSGMPSAEFRTTLTKLLWAVEKMTDLHMKSIENNNRMALSFQPYAEQAANVEAARVKADSQNFRAERAEATVEKALNRLVPVFENYAETRKHEAVTNRQRPPVGDAVIDAWRDLVESVDLPTMARIRKWVPETADLLEPALLRGDALGKIEILQLWGTLRQSDDLKKVWQELQAALPTRARDALASLAGAVGAHNEAEKTKAKAEADRSGAEARGKTAEQPAEPQTQPAG